MINNLRKKKVGFWAGDQNNFQFINPLIEMLSSNYKTYKFDYVDNVEELEKQLNSVDIAWFEWGNGPIVPASYMDSKTPIINRLHRYELYTDTPKHIQWSRVNKTIFSSPSMIRKFEDKFPKEYKDSKPEFIPIGVDTELFEFSDKTQGKNVIYIGRIHPHKNPSLLLQIAKKLVDTDSEFKLKVIGKYADELHEEYFNDQLKKLGLTNNVTVINHMPQKKLVEHLKSSDFFLITSIVEGLSQASLEAMSCGVVPVISNYWGSDHGYPSKYVYTTIDEAVKMMIKPVATRKDSRDYILKNHRLSDQLKKITSILESQL